MRTLQTAVCATVVAMAALGCRTNNNIVLLERDLRLQEDKIYELQAMLEDCRCAREATIRENESLKQELATTKAAPARPRSIPDVEMPAEMEPPSRKSPPKMETPMPPQIELPEESGAPGLEVSPPSQQQGAVDGIPSQLVINPRLTGGLDLHGAPGDGGILVAFELLDAAGQPVKSAGAVSVVVLDPTQHGAAARVARWNFAPEEIAGHYRQAVVGRGLQFELPWPGAAPKHNELQLFVRFTTPEGQKITAESRLDIRMPAAEGPALGRRSQGWSTAQSPRRAPSDTPRRASRSADRSPSSSRDDADTSEAPASDGSDERPLRQAGRPVWKPYR
jgi:hypothetical protein